MTGALAITCGSRRRLPWPVELTVPLAEMTPGTYDCQVVVLDLEGKNSQRIRQL